MMMTTAAAAAAAAVGVGPTVEGGLCVRDALTHKAAKYFYPE